MLVLISNSNSSSGVVDHGSVAVDTIPTSARWMVEEIRSISVSSPVNFTDVSAMISDSSIAENDKY